VCLVSLCVCSSGEEAARAVGVQPLHQVSARMMLATTFFMLCVTVYKSWPVTAMHAASLAAAGRQARARSGVQRQELLQKEERETLIVFALVQSFSPLSHSHTHTHPEWQRERERDERSST
jgi:hypothetical protein